MLKKILRLDGAQQLSKNEQKSIRGAGLDIPRACTYPGAPPFGGPCACIINGSVCRVEEHHICPDGTDPICPNY